MIEPAQRERLLTPKELAAWLGLSAAWVRDHATRNPPLRPVLPALKLGGAIRFRASDIEKWLEEQGVR